MNSTFAFFFTLIVAMVFIAFFRQVSEKKKYQDPIYLVNLQLINEFINLIQSLNDYVTWVQRNQIKAKFSHVGHYFKDKNTFYKKEVTVKMFNDIFGNFDKYIATYNKNYVDTKKKKLEKFFDNIEGKKLDDQQRTAVVTDEYSNLIIAGAGSGKTLTILGKVEYLVKQKNIKPENILLLSFTKKTVEELNERIAKVGVGTKAITFHKLGYDTIKKYNSIQTPIVSNEITLSKAVKEYLQKDIYSNQEALEAYIEYIACYMNIPEEYDKHGSLGNKLDTEKGINFETMKSKCGDLNIVRKKTLDTFQGEKVKSIEELTIANFLYLNGIKYEYEKTYPHSKIIYRPDFYLTDYDIWIEHFGVDENNRAKWLSFLNEEKYVEGIKIKRNTHSQYGSKLLETYSYYNRDKILIPKLREMLEKENVVFLPQDAKEIYSKVTNNDDGFGKEIVKLIESFINLSKSRRLKKIDLEALFLDKSKAQNAFMSERQNLFLKFGLPIIDKYDNILKAKKEIDFNDMINLATDLIEKNKPQYDFQYIIIDEYQDISFARFNLIKSIRDLSDAKLICVGDDWQSIYRFAGSDISLFSNFEKYLGKSEKLLIEQTYRNSQSLIDVTSRFIQKNEKQINKNPISKKVPLDEPVKFIHYAQGTLEECIIEEIGKLVTKYGKNKSILILGRHSFDVNELIEKTVNNKIRYIESDDKLEVKGFEDVKIKFLTIHKSKGIESDNVIVLNLKNHLLGFPNKITDDPILSLLLSDSEEYSFAEERRLFYVALTRTKNEVVLLVPSDISLFVEEMIKENNYLLTSIDGNLKTTNCPYCKTGKLIIRQNSSNGSQFIGCSHYPNCNQTFNDIEILKDQFLCQDCQSGFMTKRTGRYGNFLGCTNYPICRSTINLQ